MTDLLAEPFYDEAAGQEAVLPDGLRGRLSTLQTLVSDHTRSREVRFVGEGGPLDFVVDPFPRVIDAATWEGLEAGLRQRARALDRFVADVHGQRRTIADGVIPERIVATCTNLDPAARALGPVDGRPWIGIAGLDLVRGADGRFMVLEDNCRTPSGLAYALAAREALAHALDADELDHVRPLDEVPRMLRDVLDAARPDPGAPSCPVVLTDGPENSAYYEHRVLARAMGVPLVTPADLERRGSELWLAGHDAPVDVVYRRTDADTTDSPVGALLAPGLRAGTLGLVNAFGTGVADDKLVHAYVPALIRHLLGEEPLLPSVRSIDLATDEGWQETQDRLAELVVKPRDGHGGVGVEICPQLDAAGLARVRALLAADRDAYVAQECVALSTHPTLVDGACAPRHVDLRPFVLLAGEQVHVMSGGLTRVALREGSMIVNSSQDGGAKDTWVLR